MTVAKSAVLAKSGKPKNQMGDGKNLFNYTYVVNAADAHILAVKRPTGYIPGA